MNEARKRIEKREDDKVLSGTCEKKAADEHNDLSHLAKCLYTVYVGLREEKSEENVIIVPFFALHLCIACVYEMNG